MHGLPNLKRENCPSTTLATALVYTRLEFLKSMSIRVYYLLTYSMEQSPSWEANWSAASQEIPHILWNPKVHYSIHKCPPTFTILS